MVKITLSCSGIDLAVGPNAAADIQTEFRDHRPWYQDVQCHFDGGQLVLTAKSDTDKASLALLDEFSDCLSAYLVHSGEARVVSVSVEPA